ncbi:MAG TPA: hypothetical protein VGM37_05730 [Armatimonadota bacterium]|jgi:hypothetical protein
MNRHALWICAFALLAARAGAQKVADRVYGQPNFTSTGAGNTYLSLNNRMNTPRGIAAAADGVYISDRYYHRILFFPGSSTDATRVYGQPDFTTTDPNHGGIGPSSLNLPWGLAADSTGLYVADTGNNRVLFYPNGQTEASRVYGQPDFVHDTYNNGGLSGASLNGPEEVALDKSGGLYISDSGNSRILYFPPGETTPTRVYGQPDFTSGGAGMGRDHMYVSKGVGVSDDSVYVTDYANNRVLQFPLAGGSATRVFGQPDFESMAPNNPKIGPNSFQQPNGIATDDEGWYVSDYLGSRVLFFPYGSQVASAVYGETDFTTVRMLWGGVTDHGFYVCTNVAVDATGVYVCDSFNSRVLHFPKDNAPMPFSLSFAEQPTLGTAGQPFPIQPKLVVRFTDGSVATTYNGPVNVRIKPGSGPACGKLTGESTVSAVNGVATFTGLGIDAPGNYTLTALTATLPIPESAAVQVSAAPGVKAPGDVNGDGQFNMADITQTMRYLAGLEAMPR